MKKLVWVSVNDAYPEKSGYYLVCDEVEFIPRVAYFDAFGAGGDWFETAPWRIVYEIAEKILHEFLVTKGKNKAIYKEITDDIELWNLVQEKIDTYSPADEALSEKRYDYAKHDAADIEYWCEMPITPNHQTIDDVFYAESSVSAQDILSAIEPVLKRKLARDGDTMLFSPQPTWKQHHQ